MNVHSAIKEAERLLPGKPAHEDDNDPRWQAMIDLNEFIATDPGANRADSSEGRLGDG